MRKIKNIILVIGIVAIFALAGFIVGVMAERNNKYEQAVKKANEIKKTEAKCQSIREEKFRKEQIISNIFSLFPLAGELQANKKYYIMSPEGPIEKSRVTAEQIRQWIHPEEQIENQIEKSQLAGEESS